MRLRRISSKQGALELSIGTIVVIVLAMSMLILGLVLVRTIFTCVKYNVDTINDNVKAEINKLFNEEGKKTVVYLPDNEARVEKGESFGLAFSIKNTVKGQSQAGQFGWETSVGDIESGCQLNEQEAQSYVVLNGQGSGYRILPGDQLDPPQIIKIRVSEAAPLCDIKYNLFITKDGQPYATDFFILSIN